MRFVTVRELRSESAEDAGDSLRRARAVAAVKSLQKHSVTVGRHRLSRTAIEAEIALVRNDRCR